MNYSVALPELYKGIALFTPGGDLIYCIDPSKQKRWHLNLCVALQEILGLSEPPHFLVPGYTATIDRWRDPYRQEIQTFAEVYPSVQRYQSLLNTVFCTDDLAWQMAVWQDESCNPILLETYRSTFPQLWESHDLIVRLETEGTSRDSSIALDTEAINHFSPPENPQSYVLRLFISGNSIATKQTLETIHQLLEQGLCHPYTLKVIDISKHPEQAEANHVSAIPTLVRVWPQPVRRIVGELEDLPRILQIISGA